MSTHPANFNKFLVGLCPFQYSFREKHTFRPEGVGGLQRAWVLIALLGQIGLEKVDWLFVFSCAAHNLIRLPRLMAQPPEMLLEKCA